MMARIDHPLLMIWLVILALGTVMVASSAVENVSKHGFFVILALLAFGFMLLVPLRLWQASHRLAWLVAFGLCAVVLIPAVGGQVNGARRWIDLGGFTLQPAEISKFLLLVYVAGYLARFSDQIADQPLVILRLLVMIGAVAGLLLRQPDFGSVVVIGASVCGMLFIAGARLRHFFAVVALAGTALVALAYTQPYRMARLTTFTDPWSYAFDGGYQLTQALIAFGRGEFFGLGLGESIQKLDYLPEAHNDFIFAVVAEELGLLGASGLLALFAVLLLRLLRVARVTLRSSAPFAGYLVYGVALLLGIQFLINIGVNTGVLPTKGLTLPFVSYGGNSLIVSCAMLGLVTRAQMEADSG